MENDRSVIEKLWRLIGILYGFEGIVITIPHDPKESGGHQLRVWKGGYGRTSIGHVDSAGVLLFETRIPHKLSECDCCYQAELDEVGMHAEKWKKETRGGIDGVMDVEAGGFRRTQYFYDVLTVVERT